MFTGIITDVGEIVKIENNDHRLIRISCSYKSDKIDISKNNWEIFWEDIKSIKSFPTSQGSRVFYFIDGEGKSLLVPQRIENFDIFLEKIEKKTNIRKEGISYISPLWTYKLLTFLSLLMIVGEISLFLV